MQKLFIFTALFLLVVMVTPAVAAGPAPKLSKVTITGIGPDAEGHWLTPASHNVSGTVAGDTLRICVEYLGYPNWNLVFFYQNGSLISASKLENYATTYITSGGIITGYVKAYAIPFASLPGNKTDYLGQFSVKATSGSGGHTLEDHVNNVRKEKS
ncbi:MAG: DUF4879 domain-containing protein [Bacillota bacterium]